MKKVLITEDVHPSLADGLTQMGYECDERSGISQDETADIVHQFHGIVVATRIHLDKRMLDLASSLQFIARAGSGLENIDVAYAEARKIVCISSPEGNANSVAEHSVG